MSSADFLFTDLGKSSLKQFVQMYASKLTISVFLCVVGYWFYDFYCIIQVKYIRLPLLTNLSIQLKQKLKNSICIKN